MVAKKRKIANNELIILGSFAFVIAMFSTLGFLGGLDVTGLAVADTASGRVNATVDPVVDISLPDQSSVNFGSMEPDELNCTGNASIPSAPEGVEVQNDGNVAIDINITSKKTASSMFGGTSSASDFEWNCSLNQNGSNPWLYGICNLSNWAAVATTTTGSGGPGVAFVSDLNTTDATDNATLNLKVTIPADEPAATVGTTITFGAWQT